MFKRAICLLTTICLLAISFSCLVAAETNWKATLKAEQTASENSEGIVTVRISIGEISSKTGIICAMYNLYYDDKCLELVSWKNGVPANWDFSENSTLSAEDWSQILNEDGKTYFSYTLLNVAAQDGVKDDGVLYTDLQFKVLDASASTSEISITEISFIDADDLKTGTSLDLSDKTLTLNLDTEHGGDISAVTSEDVSAEDSNTESSSTTSQPSESIPGDIADENTVSVDITLNDITDPTGVSSFLIHVRYNEALLEYVGYQCIKPDDWREDTIDFENMTPPDQINGDLLFWILNADPACTVKENGTLGFRLTFKLKSDKPFETSMLSIAEPEVINGDLQEMSEGTYSISVVALDQNTGGDNAGESTGLKIFIAVAAAVLVIGGGVGIWYFVRKKKTK